VAPHISGSNAKQSSPKVVTDNALAMSWHQNNVSIDLLIEIVCHDYDNMPMTQNSFLMSFF